MYFTSKQNTYNNIPVQITIYSDTLDFLRDFFCVFFLSALFLPVHQTQAVSPSGVTAEILFSFSSPLFSLASMSSWNVATSGRSLPASHTDWSRLIAEEHWRRQPLPARIVSVSTQRTYACFSDFSVSTLFPLQFDECPHGLSFEGRLFKVLKSVDLHRTGIILQWTDHQQHGNTWHVCCTFAAVDTLEVLVYLSCAGFAPVGGLARHPRSSVVRARVTQYC